MSWPRSGRKRAALFVLLVLVLLGLLRLGPSYTYARISTDEGEVEVERWGVGPHNVIIEKKDVRVESSGW
jgi:hypothetical protein